MIRDVTKKSGKIRISTPILATHFHGILDPVKQEVSLQSVTPQQMNFVYNLTHGQII